MEKRDIGLIGFCGLGVGFLIGGNIAASIRDSEANRRVYEVQEINAQLEDQLSDSYEVSGLIVDDKGSSFEFASHPAGMDTETCQGSYVITDGVARATGSLACTTETDITN